MALVGIPTLRVSDLMSAPVTIPSTWSVRNAAVFLARAGVPAVPMVSEGSYAGMFSETDIHRRLSERARGFYSPQEFRSAVPLLGGRLPDAMLDDFARVGWTPVRELARRVRPARPEDPLPDTLEEMRRQGLAAIPVLEDGKLVGLLFADVLTLRLVEFAVAAER